jgi:WD40 repeat protein/serine/threonine protein kinase
MALEHRPATGDTEWSEVLIIEDQAAKTQRVGLPSANADDAAVTLHEADCRPPSSTVMQSVPPTDVTVWISGQSKVAGPMDNTVAAPSRAFPGPGQPSLLPEIGGYEILCELGRGSMGVVFKARQFALNRICALKMMLPSAQADAPNTERFRFQGEAESLASVLHPNVVQIFTIGESGGVPYLELEYVEGGSLSQGLNGAPRSPDDAAQLIAALAKGVAAIHARGLVHRDLKPGNVLLAADGTPKVADFGLVKVRTSEATLTPSGSILGSPSYMAPEQAEGRGEDVGSAADIYGLGAILYELLTGRPPFRGATIHQTLNQVIANDPVLPSKLTPGLPRDIETICLKCLQKKPGDRYATAEELAEDLQRYLAREPIRARPVSVWERGFKWARRRPGAAALVLALAASLIGLLSLGIWSYEKIKHHLHEAEGARADAVAETYRALVSECLALEIARPAGWRDDEIRNLNLLARMETPKRNAVELRTLATASLGGIDVREFARLEVGNSVRSLDFSHDSASLATADYGGRLRIWDLLKLEHQTVLDDPTCTFVQYSENSPTPAVRYRPGGGGLVYATYNGCVEWFDPAHPGAKRRCLRGWTQPCSISFDATGRRVAVSWTDGWITLYDSETGVLRKSIVALASWHTVPIALSPDGKWIAAMGIDHSVQLHPTDSSDGPITLGRHNENIRSIAFSSDGLLIATGSMDETVKVWDVNQKRERHTLRGHTARVNAVAFHPDSDLIASASDDRTVRLWDSRTGLALLVIRPGTESVLSVAFSPDGETLACAHDIVCLYKLTGLRERKRYRGHPHEIYGVAFSPVEPHLVVSGVSNHDMNAFDVMKGTRIRRWRGDMEGVAPLASLAVSPVGRIVATGSGNYSGIGRLNPDFSVRLWRIDDGSRIGALEGHNEPVEALAYNTDGTRLASGAKDGRLIVWELPSGRKLFESHLGDRSIASIGFLDDGRHLLAGDEGGRLGVFDLGNGALLKAKTVAGGLARFAIAPGGRRLLVGGGQGDLQELSLPDLTPLRSVSSAHHGPIRGLVYSPDGSMIFTGGEDGLVMVRDTKTLEELFTFPPYDGAIYRLAVSTDGAYLAVAGVEQRLDVWNLGLVEPSLGQMGLSWRGRNWPRTAPSLTSHSPPRRVSSLPSPIDRAWADMGTGEEGRHKKEKRSEAIAAYHRAIVFWEELNRESPGNAFCLSELAVSFGALAVYESEAGQADAASRSIKRAIAIIEPLRDEDPRVDLARCRVLALASVVDPGSRKVYLDRAIFALRRTFLGGFKDRAKIKANPDLNPLRSRRDFREIVDADYSNFGWPYLLKRGRSRSLQGRPEAILDIEDARTILRPLLEIEKSDAWLRKQWAISTVDLASLRPITAGKPSRAEGLGDAIATLEPLASQDSDAALALARAHAVLATDDHAMQATKILGRLVQSGAVDLDFLQRDPALSSLRPRADFKALAADLAFPADPFAY